MGDIEDSRKSQWRGLNTALTLMLISAPLFLVQIFGLGIFSASATGEDSLPVSIRATSQADYGRDSHTFVIPRINGNILYQIITNIPATYSAQDRIATLQADLSSPVPTMTINSQPMTPTPTLLLQTPTSMVASPTSPASITPLVTATPRVSPTPTTAPENTPANTPHPTLPISTIITIPSLVPTNLPLPTIPPLLPTIPPLFQTIPPLLPTIPPVLPTIPPLLQ